MIKTEKLFYVSIFDKRLNCIKHYQCIGFPIITKLAGFVAVAIKCKEDSTSYDIYFPLDRFEIIDFKESI